MTTRDERRERTAERILAAARAEFAERGFTSATIRSIADRAGVNASLVMQHHGSKAALFSTAVALVADDDVASEDHLGSVLRDRLDGLAPEVRALMRSMLTSPDAATVMREYLQDRIDRLTATGRTEAEAAVVVSTILGLTLARNFLELPSTERIAADDLVTAAERLLLR